jgi:hypothetical protein
MVTTPRDLRKLEGRQVSVALADGSRIDDAALVSAGRGATSTLWIYANCGDAFVPVSQVVDIWECEPSAAPRKAYRAA